MYQQYWQLQAKPFETTADADFYYPAEAHQGTLLKLRYAIENQRGAALLSGAAGLGKTLVVQTLLRQIGESFSPQIHVVYPQMPSDQLLAYLAQSLSGRRRSIDTPPIEQSVRTIEQTLAENAVAGRHAVVVIDEAQDLVEQRALETVRLLLNFEYDARATMTLLLVGQPSLLPVLDRTPGLDERLAVKCLLRRLNLEETISYIHHRLRAAGAEREIFDQAALEAVHHLAHGVPRRINRLCDLALLVGFAEEREQLGEQQVESIAEELVAVTPD